MYIQYKIYFQHFNRGTDPLLLFCRNALLLWLYFSFWQFHCLPIDYTFYILPYYTLSLWHLQALKCTGNVTTKVRTHNCYIAIGLTGGCWQPQMWNSLFLYLEFTKVSEYQWRKYTSILYGPKIWSHASSAYLSSTYTTVYELAKSAQLQCVCQMNFR